MTNANLNYQWIARRGRREPNRWVGNAPTPQGKSDHGTARKAEIRAKDIMETQVIWIDSSKTVRDAARLLAEKHISAVPVVDKGKIVGILSEGDLIQREELGTAPTVAGQRTPGANLDYEKYHGTWVRDVMSRNVISVLGDARLTEIAEIMQTKHIKRVPVTREDKLVGIVSRSDIVHTLAARPEGAGEPVESDDDIIRFKVVETLMDLPGTSPWLTTVQVSDGVVELSGAIEDEAMLEPSRAAIEHIAHVVEVTDHRTILQPY